MDNLEEEGVQAQPSPTDTEASPFEFVESEVRAEEPTDPTVPEPELDPSEVKSSKAKMSSDDSKEGDKPTTPKMGVFGKLSRDRSPHGAVESQNMIGPDCWSQMLKTRECWLRQACIDQRRYQQTRSRTFTVAVD